MRSQSTKTRRAQSALTARSRPRLLVLPLLSEAGAKLLRKTMIPENQPQLPSSAEIERLITELEQAEAYEQRLRQLIVEVRDQLAAGRIEQALSMLNTALNDIDSATDVVVPSQRVK